MNWFGAPKIDGCSHVQSQFDIVLSNYIKLSMHSYFMLYQISTMCADIYIKYLHACTEYFCWCVSDESQYDMCFNKINLYDYMMYTYL